MYPQSKEQAIEIARTLKTAIRNKGVLGQNDLTIPPVTGDARLDGDAKTNTGIPMFLRYGVHRGYTPDTNETQYEIQVPLKFKQMISARIGADKLNTLAGDTVNSYVSDDSLLRNQMICPPWKNAELQEIMQAVGK